MIWGVYFAFVCLPIQAVIKKKYGQDATNVGDEGGFAPNIQVSIALSVLLADQGMLFGSENSTSSVTKNFYHTLLCFCLKCKINRS